MSKSDDITLTVSRRFAMDLWSYLKDQLEEDMRGAVMLHYERLREFEKFADKLAELASEQDSDD